MVLVSGGRFRMGSGDFYPEERPIHEVAVSDLWVDEHPVTNAQFRRFVKATGHLTVAEQAPDAAIFLVGNGDLVSGSSLRWFLKGPIPLTTNPVWAGFQEQTGVTPYGPDSTLDGGLHPVSMWL
jgi:formylglycine-generating enzyme required for sulfatase activity